MIRKFILFAVCIFLVTGCGRDESESPATAAGTDASAALFDRIDADTPWLFANLEPLPDEISDKIWASLADMSEINRRTYTELAKELDSPLAAALLNELAAIDSREAFADRGLNPNGHWAIHAVSIYPFIHWQLTDSEAFAAMLQRIAAEGETELPWRSIDDAEVLWIDLEEFGIALHHDDHFVTIAIVPDNLALLRRVANLDQPATAFDADELADFARERGHTPHGSGFADTGRIIDLMLDPDDEMIAARDGANQLEEIAADPACRSELNALAATFPRLSLGYTEISRRSMSFDMAFETDPAFGERLTPIAGAPVNLGDSDSGLFNLGFAFNMVAARDFAREIVGAWVESPPTCRLFAHIRENAQDWQIALNQPIPPVVTNLHGFRVSVDDVQMNEEGGFGTASGTLALFMRNPQMLLGMGQMFSPELAQLDLKPGGEPQPLPPGIIPNLPPDYPLFIAMGDSALGLAVGESQREQLPAAMQSGQADSAILSYGIDFAAYGEMMQSMLSGMSEQLEGMDPDADMNEAGDALEALGRMYEYSHSSMHLTSRGIEFRSTVRLAD